MNLKNPFPSRVRLLYLYNYKCFNCGSNQGLELHHIFGRRYSCAFNACPLCKSCHASVVHTHAEHKHLFFKNVEFLLSEGYKPRDDDYAFIVSELWLTNTAAWERLFGVDK